MVELSWIILANKRSIKSTSKTYTQRRGRDDRMGWGGTRDTSAMQHLIFTHSIWNTLPSFRRDSFEYFLLAFLFQFGSYGATTLASFHILSAYLKPVRRDQWNVNHFSSLSLHPLNRILHCITHNTMKWKQCKAH